MERKFPDSNFHPIKSLEIPGNQEDGWELIPACQSLSHSHCRAISKKTNPNRPGDWDHRSLLPGCQHPCLHSQGLNCICRKNYSKRGFIGGRIVTHGDVFPAR